MKIIPIFEPHLYAFQFEESIDEFTRLFDFWLDFERLEDFYANNNELLKYENIEIEFAIKSTIEIAVQLYDSLKHYKDNLDSLFQNLNDLESTAQNLVKQKTKKRWIRLYAIRIEPQYYIITGGTIKQSYKMEDHPSTIIELSKLEKGRNYLRDNGVFDADSFFEIEI